MSDAFPFDRRIWRQAGDPLVEPSGAGPLGGYTLAVTDLIALAGQRIGAGNPAWLERAVPETAHAPVVARLLAAGARVVGIARCDEFGYGLAGANDHYGAVPNGDVIGRISGGSSSGAATAVALGHADVGLGKDTSGGIRVPAAYQGLWGFRATPGAIGSTGVMALSPTYDSMGWVASDAATLAAVGDVLLPRTPEAANPLEIVTAEELIEIADADVAKSVREVVEGVRRDVLGLWVPDAWLTAFATVVAYEAWAVYGGWMQLHVHELGKHVGARFERGGRITRSAAVSSSVQLAKAKRIIEETFGNRVLAIPTTPTIAPLAASATAAESVRLETVRLNCIASIAGLPVINVPLRVETGEPAGLSLVGPAGSDRALLDLAGSLA